LVLIGLQGRKIDVSDLPPSNLTFLVDVSGSMMSADKLPLVQQSLKLLVDQLRPSDRVSLVAYAGRAGLVLAPTGGDQKTRIKEAIDNLEAGGSTAGGQGIQLAYKTAREYFIKEGNNRVILCTDGDFNVGVSSDDALERMIEEERKTGVFLTVLGFGTGNYQDAKMQKLADKGNGNHAYIDQLSEAKKVLISEFGGTLFTIAKDVKLQVEFNPAKVKAYRLIGYENRLLNKEDFNDDRKDAGDLGSGHTVTALYELVPPGAPMPEIGKVDSLRYQTPLKAVTTGQAKFADEVLQVKLRYKQPDSETSSLLVFPLKSAVRPMEQLSENFRFSAAVAAFGMLLRHSEFKGTSSYQAVRTLARQALGDDIEGYRREFLQLVDRAAQISGKDVAIRE
jgi:Ca-activated chloride channel family protein